MTVPLSPNAIVWAALEADIMLLDDLYKWLHQQWIGLDRELSEGSLGQDTFNMRERVYAAWSASRRALSTPVPEEGLPRGTASAAEPKSEAWHWRSRFKGGTWDAWENGRFGRPVPDWLEVEEKLLPPPPITEPGAGAASALPSPLPSQGEPVADLIAALQAACETAWANSSAIGLFKAAAEALAAERARADSLKAELDEARQAIQEDGETIAECVTRAEAAEARADRAEEALKAAAAVISDLIFAAETTLACLNSWNGGRGCVADVEGIVLRARNILKETPHG